MRGPTTVPHGHNDFTMRVDPLTRHGRWLMLAGALLALLIHPELRGQALPPPWDRVSGLSQAERNQILAITDSTERALTQLLPRQASTVRTELLARGRSGDSATRETRYQLAHIAKRARFERDVLILGRLSGQPRLDASQVLSEYVDTAQIFAFDSFSAKQQEPFWCWAAALQTVFAHAGVRVSQEDVGSLIGTSDSGPVDSTAIRSITGWHMSDDGPWTSECSLLPKAAANDPGVVVGLLNRNRPVVAVIDDDHVVVIHRVVLRPFPRLSITSVTWFDPYSGNQTMNWADASKRLTDVWSCWAVPPAN
jgi:hypothetical protein